MSRFVIIDDTDPSIQYSGTWFEVDNTQINLGINGPPFNNTLHGVNVTANFSFPFSGSAVIVYGTSITSNTSGDPTWECFIDDTSIGSSLSSSDMMYGDENNWVLCGGGPSQFQDGPHLLTVNANVSTQPNFWFDQIQYVPSANVSLNQSLLRIDASDSAIQYSPEWEHGIISINYTTTQVDGNSSTMDNVGNCTYEFFGTSISLYGTLEIATAPIPNASYTIDDQEPISFPVGTLSNLLFNQLFFKTGQLSLGQHNLVVTYSGNDTQPFKFNYFVQQGTVTPSSTTTSSNTSTSTNVSLASLSISSPGKPTGAIIGGVIGGLVFISLLLALFFFRRRRPKALMAPFTASPTSNGQFLSSHSISGKSTHRNQSSPSSPNHPFTGSQTNLDSNTKTRVPQAAVDSEPSTQQSSSSQGANARILRHQDSGVRIPPVEDDVVELPPFYTPG